MLNDCMAIWILEYVFGGVLVVVPIAPLSAYPDGRSHVGYGTVCCRPWCDSDLLCQFNETAIAPGEAY